MTTAEVRLTRTGGICGVLGPVVSVAGILGAALSDPTFRWDQNALSDLGVGPAAAWFNSGVFLGGLFLMPFAMGLRVRLNRGVLPTVGSAILIMGGASLSLVGVMTVEYPGFHGAVALGYFFLVPIGLPIVGMNFLDVRRRLFAIGTGVLALFSIVALPFLLTGVGFAVPELIEAIVLATWFAGTGADLVLISLKKRFPAAAPA